MMVSWQSRRYDRTPGALHEQLKLNKLTAKLNCTFKLTLRYLRSGEGLFYGPQKIASNGKKRELPMRNAFAN